MDRVTAFEHRGVPMVLIDLSDMKPGEILATVGPAAAAVRSRPAKSLCTITKVDGAQFNSDVVAAMKELAKGNEPHVRTAAIVGLAGLQRIVFSAVAHFTGRSFLLCDSLDEAKERLVAAA